MSRVDLNVTQQFFSAVRSQNVTVLNMQVYSSKVQTYVKLETAAPPLPRLGYSDCWLNNSVCQVVAFLSEIPHACDYVVTPPAVADGEN